VVLCSVPPVGRDLERIARDPAGVTRINAWIETFARERKYSFVDYRRVLADSDGAMRGDYSKDGIHPNEAAYQAMMSLLQPAVELKARTRDGSR
jgi:lysophospholipase L1-like esterase